jgi:adenine deaminase
MSTSMSTSTGISTIERLIDAALGRTELDLVVRGGRLLDVYRGQWIDGDIGIAGDRIVRFGARDLEGREVLDATGQWVVPGFFEPHFHAGGSHLAPWRLAEALLARGTTSTVCDFQEHYAVVGVDASRSALDEARQAGLRLWYLAPIQAFVTDELGVAGRRMRKDDLLEMLSWPETVAINEPPPGPVLGKNRDALEVIAATLAAGKIYTGHAPKFSGQTLQAYAATGASSDHESTEAGEAWEKLGLGMAVMMRQGSACPDLEALVGLAVEHPGAARHMMLATDEVDPVDLADEGHVDARVRYAVRRGVDPVIAYQMVTINSAQYYRKDHEVGSLAPGRYADLVILDDPEACTVDRVLAGGRLVGAYPTPPPDPAGRPAGIRSRITLPGPLGPEDFRVPVDAPTARVRVVEVADGSLISRAGEAELAAVDGSLAADPGRDLAKMAVIEGFSGAGGRSIAFTHGFGLHEGAVATTYVHPYYNVLVVGTDDDSMAQAGNRLAELGGGIVVVRGGQIVREWLLDEVGVFSNEPLATVRDEFAAMNEAIRSLGCPFKAPVLALSFVALPTIPAYGLTTKGLYDVNRGQFVPGVLGGDAR